MNTTPLTLHLELGERSYDILIGDGLLETVGERLAPLLRGRQAAVVTNTTVAPLYLERVTRSLAAAGFTVLPIVLADGEETKDWRHWQQVIDRLLEARCERTTALIALGGGVVGDLTGFVAATFLRGVPFVQLPTTLLSQVDASVGGKTGINHPLGKNLIGAFYQPRLVMIDLATLESLPRRELVAGMAEVIKYGIIRDAGFFQLLEERIDQLLNLERTTLGEVIHRCTAIKAEVVAADERESGARALLNLGHTFGHAIESLSGYGRWLHGEAVAAGTVVAADLSQRLGLCGEGDVARIRDLLRRTGLPVTIPAFPTPAYLESMSRDKKVEAGRIRFILVEAIGRAIQATDAPAGTVALALAANMAGTDRATPS
ncbi:MAG: 3-dehydroquinate synthase [Magnetococcales bacterium]|nr:3-dehydroquinate synthase [Magnetococcales bacterium]